MRPKTTYSFICESCKCRKKKAHIGIDKVTKYKHYDLEESVFFCNLKDLKRLYEFIRELEEHDK